MHSILCTLVDKFGTKQGDLSSLMKEKLHLKSKKTYSILFALVDKFCSKQGALSSLVKEKIHLKRTILAIYIRDIITQIK